MSLGFASRTSISCVSNTRLVLCPRWLRAILIFEVTYVVSHVLAGLFMFNFREQSSSTYLCSQTQIGVFGSCGGVHCSEHPRKLSESERVGVCCDSLLVEGLGPWLVKVLFLLQIACL